MASPKQSGSKVLHNSRKGIPFQKQNSLHISLHNPELLPAQCLTLIESFASSRLQQPHFRDLSRYWKPDGMEVSKPSRVPLKVSIETRCETANPWRTCSESGSAIYSRTDGVCFSQSLQQTPVLISSTIKYFFYWSEFEPYLSMVADFIATEFKYKKKIAKSKLFRQICDLLTNIIECEKIIFNIIAPWPEGDLFVFLHLRGIISDPTNLTYCYPPSQQFFCPLFYGNTRNTESFVRQYIIERPRILTLSQIEGIPFPQNWLFEKSGDDSSKTAKKL